MAPVPDSSPDFVPAPFLSGAHVQTIVGKLRRRPPGLPVRRERWETPDDDFVDVDFTDEASDPTRPLVLILHGLEGSSRRSYVRILMGELQKRGLAAGAFNFRGCSGEPNRLPRAYHSGDSAEVSWVIDRLRARWPGRPLGAAGFSLGGNVLLKYLGERGTSAGLGAAAVASVPFDLALAQETLAAGGIRRVYAHYFLSSLKRKVQAKSELLGAELLRSVARCRSIAEFDDVVTAPIHGFRNAAEYYARSSAAGFVGSVETPTLIVHARDDPFLPESALPLAEIRANPALRALVSDRGGHQGFLAGTVATPEWWCERSMASFLGRRLV